MEAEVSACYGADSGERGPERVNPRNRLSAPRWHLRAGAVELAIPVHARARASSSRLLEFHRRAGWAMVRVVAQASVGGVSPYRVEKPAQSLGTERGSAGRWSQRWPGSWTKRLPISSVRNPRATRTSERQGTSQPLLLAALPNEGLHLTHPTGHRLHRGVGPIRPQRPQIRSTGWW
jgi:hypothetical protein